MQETKKIVFEKNSEKIKVITSKVKHFQIKLVLFVALKLVKLFNFILFLSDYTWVFEKFLFYKTSITGCVSSSNMSWTSTACNFWTCDFESFWVTCDIDFILLSTVFSLFGNIWVIRSCTLDFKLNWFPINGFQCFTQSQTEPDVRLTPNMQVSLFMKKAKGRFCKPGLAKILFSYWLEHLVYVRINSERLQVSTTLIFLQLLSSVIF